MLLKIRGKLLAEDLAGFDIDGRNPAMGFSDFPEFLSSGGEMVWMCRGSDFHAPPMRVRRLMPPAH